MKHLSCLLLLCLSLRAQPQQPAPEHRLPRQVLRTGLFGWTQGLLPVELEQRLGRGVSVNFITGLTFHSTANELYAYFWEDGKLSDNFSPQYSKPAQPYDIGDEYSFRWHSHRRAQLGYQAGLEFYFYPVRSRSNRNHFFGLGAVYRRFNSRAEMVDPGKPVLTNYVFDEFPRLPGQYQKEAIMALDCMLSLGTASSWTKHHIYVAVRFQIGARLQNATMQDLGVLRLDNRYYGVNAIHHFNNIRPVLGFDLLLGGWR